MKRKILPVIMSLFFVMGCTFNIQEQSKEVTLTASSVGVTKVSIDEELLEDNNISTQGIDAQSIIVATHASMLLLQDSDDDLSNLQLSISQNGEISYSYSGDNWACITIGKISMDIDKTVDLDFESVSGDIKIMDMESFLDLETVSGNCDIETNEGCKVKSTSGDVRLNVSYDSLIDTTDLYVKTVSGNVDMFLPNDTLAYTTTVCEITLKTTSGDVTITVPVDFTANLNFSTTSGDKKISSSFIDDSGSSNTIKCATTSGDLRIKTYSK